jgi:hypothetical protein
MALQLVPALPRQQAWQPQPPPRSVRRSRQADSLAQPRDRSARTSPLAVRPPLRAARLLHRSPLPLARRPVCPLDRSPLPPARRPVCPLDRLPLPPARKPACPLDRPPLPPARRPVCPPDRPRLPPARKPACPPDRLPLPPAHKPASLPDRLPLLPGRHGRRCSPRLRVQSRQLATIGTL